jgi:hypothetical protein
MADFIKLNHIDVAALIDLLEEMEGELSLQEKEALLKLKQIRLAQLSKKGTGADYANAK